MMTLPNYGSLQLPGMLQAQAPMGGSFGGGGYGYAPSQGSGQMDQSGMLMQLLAMLQPYLSMMSGRMGQQQPGQQGPQALTQQPSIQQPPTEQPESTPPASGYPLAGGGGAVPAYQAPSPSTGYLDPSGKWVGPPPPTPMGGWVGGGTMNPLAQQTPWTTAQKQYYMQSPYAGLQAP